MKSVFIRNLCTNFHPSQNDGIQTKFISQNSKLGYTRVCLESKSSQYLSIYNRVELCDFISFQSNLLLGLTIFPPAGGVDNKSFQVLVHFGLKFYSCNSHSIACDA